MYKVYNKLCKTRTENLNH